MRYGASPQPTLSTLDRTPAAILLSREPHDHALDALHPASVSGLASWATSLRPAFASAVVAALSTLLVSGRLSNHVVGYGALALVATVFTVIGARKAA